MSGALRIASIAVAVAMAVAVAVPATALAQPGPGAGVLADARLAEIRGQLSAATSSAAEAGLPAEWLLDKVAEGLAKGVAPGQILSAVEHLGERMRAAARIQRSLPQAHDAAHARSTLHALVDALSVGAPEAAVEQLVRAIARTDPDAVHASIVAVADLGERSFRGQAAVDAVALAFERGGREGLRSLVQSADAIGAGSASTRLQALGAAASRITRPTPLAGREQSRARSGVARPTVPTRDRAVGTGRASHPGPPR